MGEPKPIDILQQFAAQAAREEMLAFFDFTLARDGTPALSGLCKISKPKRGSSQLKYLSLTFVIDVPDAAAASDVDEIFRRVDAAALRATLPQIVDIVPMPSMSARAENYMCEMDLLLEELIDPGQTFVEERLIPALREVMHLHITDVVWWANAAPARPDDSLLGSVRQFLHQHWSTAKK